ncbi:hypothetical protein [Cellulomonas sp. P5_E12]
MSRSRVGWIVVAALVGIAAALVGNWWTVAAMVFLIAGQVASERHERRRASTAEPA